MARRRVGFAFAVVSILWLAALPGAARAGEPSAGARVLVPAVENFALNLAIWGYDRIAMPGTDFDLKFPGVLRYPARRWVFDHDDFDTNQFLHPYHGVLAFTSARASGLGFWQSALYPFFTSLMWELFMETQAPSPNDLLMNSLGGIVLGEALYRLALIVLHSGGLGAELGAFVAAPMAALNWLVFGQSVHADEGEYSGVSGQLVAGAVVDGTLAELGGERNIGPRVHLALEVAKAGPRSGAAGPFDFFDLTVDFAAGAGSIVPAGESSQWSVFARGLLFPRVIGEGERGRGFWGLVAGFDYDEPSVLRVSSVELGPGLTGELRLLGPVVLRGTAAGSWVMFANAGAAGEPITDRAYHLGPSAQALLDLELSLGSRVTLRATGREYWLGGPLGGAGGEEVTHAIGSIRYRIGGPHAFVFAAEHVGRASHDRGEPPGAQEGTFFRAGYAYVVGAEGAR